MNISQRPDTTRFGSYARIDLTGLTDDNATQLRDTLSHGFDENGIIQGGDSDSVILTQFAPGTQKPSRLYLAKLEKKEDQRQVENVRKSASIFIDGILRAAQQYGVKDDDIFYDSNPFCAPVVLNRSAGTAKITYNGKNTLKKGYEMKPVCKTPLASISGQNGRVTSCNDSCD